MRDIMRVLSRTNALDDRVRKILVDSLYTQPASLAIGALCGSVTSLVTAYESQVPQITATAIIVTILGIVRVVVAHVLPRMRNQDPRRLELLYEIGAFAYSAAIGLIGALAIAYDVAPTAQLLAVCNAVGYAVGIAARVAH